MAATRDTSQRRLQISELVRQHGGSIRAEGEVGKGATFVFGLPQAPVAE